MVDVRVAAIREYMDRCLRPNEPLLCFEGVMVENASGAPPMTAGDPRAWLGLTAARLITYYEGSRSVASVRLGDLARLELKKGPFRRQLTWQGPIAFDGESADISKAFAKIADPILSGQTMWEAVADETTTCVVRVEPVDDPGLLAVAEELGLPTEHRNAYCVTCGGWCGSANEDDVAQLRECGACLRRITSVA